MRYHVFHVASLIVLLSAACGRAPEEAHRWADESSEGGYKVTAEEEPMAWSGLANNGSLSSVEADSTRRLMSSSAARISSDTNRRFIRTADLRFRVKDVAKATYAIEDIVAGFGGFVQDTRLTSEVDERYLTPISPDSVLETTRFSVVNRATIRVPVARLDTLLKTLSRFVDFLDHRTVRADDVRLLLLSNRMMQQRVAHHAERVEQAIDEQGRKLRETAGAEDRLLDRREQADQAALSNLGLEDRITFSTITLEIYQRQSVRHEVLPNERNIARYEPGFFSKLGDAIAHGWRMLLRFLLFLAGNWSIILIAVGAFALLRWFMRRQS